MTTPGHILDLLCSYKKTNKSVFNPWKDSCPFDADKNEFKQRQLRLTWHLSCPNPKVMLIGEAAGYQGCRYSGITFTSEKILLTEGIPRISTLTKRITNRPLPFNEPSATIVWKCLRENKIQDQTILWNAFPFHPMKTGIHTNRTPTRQEIDSGSNILGELLSLYDSKLALVAVGKKSEMLLSSMGLNPMACVRHPAFGGANEFRRGMRSVVQKVFSHHSA